MNSLYQFLLTQWLKGKGTEEAIRYIVQKAYGTVPGNNAFSLIKPILDKYSNSNS